MKSIYEILREAWDAGKPEALNEIAERWALAGQLKTPLYDALERLAVEVRGTTDDDEVDEPLIGLMDRLTGWSHESNFIRTQGGTPLDEIEIARLPRWAKVAFAARCARRVLPVFHQKWPDAPVELFTALQYATETCDLLASQGGKSNTRISLLGAVVCAAYVCDASYNADRNRDRAKQVIRQLGKAIAVLETHQHAAEDVYQVISGNAALALADGIATSRDNYPFAVEFARSLIRKDFITVLRKADENNWNDETPVPPESFGTLVFDGMPIAWSRYSLLAVESAKSSGDIASSLAKVGIEIVNAMNRYYSSRDEEPISLGNSASFVPDQLTVAV